MDKPDACRFIQYQQKRAGKMPTPFNDLMMKSEQELTEITYELSREVGQTTKLADVAKIRETKDGNR